jgi:hypothetical protein
VLSLFAQVVLQAGGPEGRLVSRSES